MYIKLNFHDFRFHFQNEKTELSLALVIRRRHSFFTELIVNIYLLLTTLLVYMYCVVDSSDGCGGEKCHMYASCQVQPGTGKEECKCQLGFTGNGVDCKGY